MSRRKPLLDDALGGFDRRTLLSAAAAAALVAGCTKAPSAAPPPPAPSPPPPSKDKAVEAFVPVLVAMADRLLPKDAWGPGAADADVGTFFRVIFADQRLATIHPLLKRGCSFLMRVAKAESKKAFAALDDAARDDIIRRLVDNAMRPDGFSGPTFVRIVMALTLEGFLGDPRHGGNKGGIGWKTVGFSPDGRPQGVALPVLP